MLLAGGTELSEGPGKKAELWLPMGSTLGSTTEAESSHKGLATVWQAQETQVTKAKKKL